MDKNLIENVLDEQEGYNSLKTNYYSPLGCVERDITCVNSLLFPQLKVSTGDRFCSMFELMLQEYRDIYEPVIVENPFTQVTECGEGLRQFHIGLTRSKIIFGCDDFDHIDLEDFSNKYLEPETETFKLVSLMPLQFLKINFYRKKNRSIMRICICGEEQRPMLFEFGGHLYKSLFWSTWRERIATIKIVHPDLFYITCASPYSSTDVLNEEELCFAQIHADSNYPQLSWRNYSYSGCSLFNY